MNDNHSQVVLGWIHDGVHTTPHFTESYANLRMFDSHERQLIDFRVRPLISSGHYLHKNRNIIVQRFLDEHKAPWLMFLDTDMQFGLSGFYLLYDQAVHFGPGIHAGMYYTRFDEYDDIRPTWVKWRGPNLDFITTREGYVCRDDLDGVGMGFTLIHREVLEALAKRRPKYLDAWFGHDPRVYSTGVSGDDGEDYCFCTRAKAEGFKVYGHENIVLGHLKAGLVTGLTR